MNKIVSNKNNVILGLQKENARLQAELHDAIQAELATRENADAERAVTDALRDRVHSVEVAAAEAQRDMLARPHRATVERCQEARRESDRVRIEKQMEFNEVRKALTERVRKLRSWTRTGSFVLVGLVFGFAIGVLVA